MVHHIAGREDAIKPKLEGLVDGMVALHSDDDQAFKKAGADFASHETVAAPASGRIVNLKVFTAGGVIAPREPLMEIVPADDTLVIEVQMSPTDIDAVVPGLPVQLRFTAFNHNTTPTFNGRVTQVSADRLTDSRTGQTCYTGRVALEDDGVQAGGFKLYPGMPVEAMIVTGQRTPLDYFVRPIRASLTRALREE